MPRALKISPEELSVCIGPRRGARRKIEQQELARREERLGCGKTRCSVVERAFWRRTGGRFWFFSPQRLLHPLVGCGHCGLGGSSRGYLSSNESSAGGGYGAGGEPGGHGSMPPLVVESHRAYKGYFGKVEFDDGANVFHGEVINLRDVLTAKRST